MADKLEENKGEGLSLAEEYKMLLEGRRLTNRRQASTSVMERQKQEELLQQQQRDALEKRRAEKKKLKKVDKKAAIKTTKKLKSHEVQSLNPMRHQLQQQHQQKSKPKIKKKSLPLREDSPIAYFESKLQSSFTSQVESPEDSLTLYESIVSYQQESDKAARSQRLSSSMKTPKERVAGIGIKEFEEQIKDFKALDKVLPYPQYIEGCFVEVSGQIATITSVSQDLQKTTVAQQDGGSLGVVPVRSLKFLTRAYECLVSDLDPNQVPEGILSQQDGAKVALIQVIWAFNEQDVASSIHRLHVLTIKDGVFCLTPATFVKGASSRVEISQEGTTESSCSSFVYGDQTQKVLEMARRIHKAFRENYLQKVEQFQVAKDNIHSLLLSVCRIQEKSSQKSPKTGILLRVMDDVSKGRTLAFFRLFSVLTNQKERVEWVDLEEVEIRADLSLGFVDQECLSKISTHDPSKLLKFRHLKMTSWEQSIQEKQKSLRTEQDYVIREAKVSSSEQEERCKKCKYLADLDGIKSLECSRCTSKFHEKCLQPHERNIGHSEEQWRCPDCLRCTNCLSIKKCDQLLTCQTCNSPYHFECIHKGFKNRIRALGGEGGDSATKESMLANKFKCEHCIACQNCGRNDAGDKLQNKWSRDFNLCSDCNQKKEAKLFCPVCERFWPEQMEVEDNRHDKIQCNICSMWVHSECDRMLTEDNLSKFLPQGNDQKSTLLYTCSGCRIYSRLDFLNQLVSFLIREDRKRDFYDPFWERDHPHYLKVIKKPICFQMIKKTIRSGYKYLLHPEQFKGDIERIFTNAKTFNAMQSDIHKAASRLLDKFNSVISQGRIWEIIETNSKATKDEIQFTTQKRGQNVKEEGLYQEFHLRPNLLFQPQEQLDYKALGLTAEEEDDSLLQKRTFPLRDLADQKRKVMADISCVTLLPSPIGQPLIEKATLLKLLEQANRNLIIQSIKQTPMSHELNDAPDAIVPGLAVTHQISAASSHVSTIGQQSILAQLPLQTEKSMPERDQWQSLMDDLRNEDRDQWYQNPAKISFDDPALIYEEMCYLCGAFGNHDDFLSCNLCAESFHPYCLPYPMSDRDKLQPHWLCYNCMFCQICHSSQQWEGLIMCSVCDKVSHFWCLKQKLVLVPDCDWKCHDCFNCRACGTKQFFTDEDIENKVNLDPEQKFLESFDFEFCFKCGKDESRKSRCSICDKKTGLGHIVEPKKKKKEIAVQLKEATPISRCHQQGLYKCISCENYSHLSCSNTSLQTLKQIAVDKDPAGVFKCMDCLIVNKLPSYFVMEQCEVYLNIHNTLAKHKLLLKLVHSIVKKYLSQNAHSSQQADLFVTTFIQQNKNFFNKDKLINEWLSLLETQVQHVEPDQDSVLVSMKSADVVSTADSFDEKDLLKEVLPQTHPIEEHKRYRDLFGHKEGFLPQRRDVYKSMHQEVTRFGLKDEFISQDNLMEQITLPTEATLAKVDFADVLARIELRAVMKLRLRFMSWFESMVENSMRQSHLFRQKPTRADVDQPMEEEQQLSPPQTQMMCSDLDLMIDNPQKRLSCILCKRSGELKVTGRLIPFQINQFVHVNCALWTTEVAEGTEDDEVCSEIYNFYFAFRMFKNSTCSICLKKGATLVCSNRHGRQSKNYHFPCAYQSGKITFAKDREIFCESCTEKGNMQAGLPQEFASYPKRRIIIVKNIYPQFTNAFDQQMKKIGLIKPEDAEEAEGVVQCNHWRPYYYDMFNRAGNLTVLSLSRKRNAIIENLHTYKNKSNTWHDRMKRKFPEEDFSEFAAARIYWKYNQECEGPPKKKGYYILTQDTCQEIELGDDQSIAKQVSKRIREMSQKIQRLHQQSYQGSCPEQNSLDEFWNSQIVILKKRYPQLSQENIFYTKEMLSGLGKYPIQFWNNPGSQLNLDLKDISVASFFYKSAVKVLESQQIEVTGKLEEPASGEADQVRSNKASEPHPEQSGPVASLETLFKRMLAANKVTEDVSPRLLDIQTDASTRHFNYEQLMAALGKKTLLVRQKERNEAISAQLENESDKSDGSVEKEIKKRGRKGGILLQANDMNMAMKYRTSKEKPKHVEVWQSKIHRNGLFACQQIAAGEIVIEYVGEKIRESVADKREQLYEKLGVGDCYLFALDKDYIIDATFYGCKARYINHSCDPNLKSEKIIINGETHIVFIAIKNIQSGDELTFDYQFETEAEKLDCFCGSANCKGRLN